MAIGCQTDPNSNYSGPGYIAGLRREGNPYAQGRSEEETSLVMKKDNVSYWDGDGVPGSPAITIDISQQRAYFYKGSQLVGVAQISTGTASNATPLGNFKIIQKNKDHESNLYGDYKYPDGSIAKKEVDTSRDKQPPGTVFDGADMPYFMRFTGGVGMHTGYLPGFAASHGCVRMPHYMAQKFFENVSIGTPVQVVP
ncbi:MAG: L,D-transpeptidase family protein [Verrucomicrobiae bacterium]|nr:L,D-transpeptidase family protein [Verrucomicrobiae bacterium]